MLLSPFNASHLGHLQLVPFYLVEHGVATCRVLCSALSHPNPSEQEAMATTEQKYTADASNP